MTRSQRNLTEARKAKITEKVDRKGRKPERNRTGKGKKKHFRGCEVTEIWAHQAELVRKPEKDRKKKLMEQWGGESRRH